MVVHEAWAQGRIWGDCASEPRPGRRKSSQPRTTEKTRQSCQIARWSACRSEGTSCPTTTSSSPSSGSSTRNVSKMLVFNIVNGLWHYDCFSVLSRPRRGLLLKIHFHLLWHFKYSTLRTSPSFYRCREGILWDCFDRYVRAFFDTTLPRDVLNTTSS